VIAGPEGDQFLAANPDAAGFLMDADRHLKAIATSGIPGLTGKTQLSGKPGVIDLGRSGDVGRFIEFARNGRVWERDPA
jgi:hypothetical protein